MTAAIESTLTEARKDVVLYLCWLADQPDGIPHRHWLYRAAYALRHLDASTPTWTDGDIEMLIASAGAYTDAP